MSLARDLKDGLHSIDKKVQKKRTRLHIVKHFMEFIRFLSLKRFVIIFCLSFPTESEWTQNKIDISYRLLSDFQLIFQDMITLLFLGATGAMCLSMLMIQIDLVQVKKITSYIIHSMITAGISNCAHMSFYLDFSPTRRCYLWYYLSRYCVA